jgi:hypothetical protein
MAVTVKEMISREPYGFGNRVRHNPAVHLLADFRRGEAFGQEFERVGHEQACAPKCHGSMTDFRIGHDVLAKLDRLLHVLEGKTHGRAVDKKRGNGATEQQ